ncbi:leucine-rich repeat-containing protein [Pyrus ussuriensis x Pyrus communis]|uniref:Leucine-rich repeat-containing protein n=1 Tax=Pyrus ussuriensis x Pyrus communis TaxID=2448454 RepID=A0A5N5I412_9ROSA|nr:leucine-rich repeat-containing protein [Pyrus ussuriensis x Pyrus communis]
MALPQSVRCSSSTEGEEGREEDPLHGQMINKLASAVMKKFVNSNTSQTLTPELMSRIKISLSEAYPVFFIADHPTYAVMIQKAVAELNEEGGSTEEAVSKFIREHFDCLPLAHERLLSHHLKKLSESGEIVSASKNCYMLPAPKIDSYSQREPVEKPKRGDLGRRIIRRNDFEPENLAVEQVELTGQQREHAWQSQEPCQKEEFSKAIDDEDVFPEKQNELQDELNGRNRQAEMQEAAMVVQKYKVTEEQVEETKQRREHEQQSQEMSLEEQHSKVIDDQGGSPEEQQDEVNGQKCKNQIQEVAVIVEKHTNSKQKATEEEVELTEKQREHDMQIGESDRGEYTKLIDDQNGCLELQTELNGQQSQTQMQEVAMTFERQNNANQKCKVAEECVELTCVEVTEQRSHGQQSEDAGLLEQHGEVIDDQSVSPYEQCVKGNGQQSENQMEEVPVIVEQQNTAKEKYKATEEPVEVTDKQGEHKQQNPQEKHNMVIESHNGSSDDLQDEVNGQQTQTHVQEIAVIVENQCIAEHDDKVNEDEEYELTEQHGERGQQSEEEQHNNIDYQNGSPEKQNEQPDDADGQPSRIQMQEIAVTFEKKIDAEQNYKATEEIILAQEDEQIEQQCQSKEQQCEMTTGRLQIEGIEREIQLLEEQVEIMEKLTAPERQIEIISEQNKPQEPIDLISQTIDSCNMQELSSNKQEKDAAIVINSSPLTSQKLPHHGSSHLSEDEEQKAENVIEENAVEMELTKIEQSCEKQRETQEWRQQRQLLPRRKKPSESDCGVPKAPKFQDGEEQQAENVMEQSYRAQHQTEEQQKFRGLGLQDQRPSDQQGENACQELEHEQQPRQCIQEMGVELDYLSVKMSFEPQKNTDEPGQQRQLRPWRQRQSTSEVSITPNLQEAEKTEELKASAEKTGQTQQQRQLRPRSKMLSESGQAATGSRVVLLPSQSLDEECISLSNSGRSRMQKSGGKKLCQQKNQHENHSTQHKRCTPEPTIDTLGSILLSQNTELPNTEAFQDLGPTAVDALSQPMDQKTKKLKSKPTTTKVPDELVLTSQQLVEEPHTPQLKPRSVVEFSTTIVKLQQLRHMKLRSHSQIVSQSDPAVSMTESSPSQHQCEQPQEEHHGELQQPKHQKQKPPKPKETVDSTMRVLFPTADQQPQKQERARPRKEKLATAATGDESSLPDKRKKQLEQHKKPKQARRCIEKLATAETSDESLPDKCHKQMEQPEKRKLVRRTKEKLATSPTGDESPPDKFQKQLEHSQKKRKQGRPSKLGTKSTVSGMKLTLKNRPCQQKHRGRGRPRKVTE